MTPRRPWLSLLALLAAGCGPGGPRPAAVPAGDQELAWIAPGTAGLEWERFVLGVQVACQRLARQGGDWRADVSGAFRDGGDVPEVAVAAPAAGGRLLVRWYKQTSDVAAGDWVRMLARRSPPPLAVVGGSTTDRARDLAEALAALPPGDPGRPLLLLTTATAVHVVPEDPPDGGLPVARLLTGIYAGRTFRFCFNNRQLAADALGFVEAQPDLRPAGSPPVMFAVEWDDDPYSQDFLNRTKEVLHAGGRSRYEVRGYRLPYSVGGYYRPNPREAMLAAGLIGVVPRGEGRRSLLVVPAVAGPARRVLRALTGLDPLVGEHLVAVAGDAISLNTVYRDGDFAWSVRALPVPLVLTAHENPVAWGEVPVERPAATDEVLLGAELTRLVAGAAFAGGRPADAPERLAAGLRAASREDGGAYFDESGDRAGGGTYVVCLRPGVPGRGETGTLTVARQARGRWETVATLPLEGDRGELPGRP